MFRYIITIILSLLLVKEAVAQTNTAITKRQKQFNVVNNLAIGGYDPVAYFKSGKAVKGSKEFAVNAEGIIYYCSSAANKALLVKNYKAYEPQYGGWCAYAMGSSGKRVEVDPETFKIVDGKLFLFYNAYFNNTLKLWNTDEISLLKKADNHWKSFYN